MKNAREEKKLIPTIVDSTTKELLKRNAQKTEGLFRVSGNATTLLSFLDHVNQGAPICLSTLDVHTIAGILKLFFRRLPEPIMTFERYDSFLDVTNSTSSTEKVEKYKKLISELAETSQFILQHIFSFFFLLASYKDVNKMNESNIAIVMAPILLYTKVNDLASCSRQSTSNEVIEDLIVNYKSIFTVCTTKQLLTILLTSTNQEISIRRKALEADMF